MILTPGVYKLFEAFQSLEDSVFRLDDKGSAAGYKHGTAEISRCLELLIRRRFILTVPTCAPGTSKPGCGKP